MSGLTLLRIIFFILDQFSWLDARIESLMGQNNNQWFCTVCGKTAKKHHLRNHIESFHIEDHPGVSCNICGAVAKSRNALASHKTFKHKIKLGMEAETRK